MFYTEPGRIRVNDVPDVHVMLSPGASTDTRIVSVIFVIATDTTIVHEDIFGVKVCPRDRVNTESLSARERATHRPAWLCPAQLFAEPEKGL
jgi:hypothetical protein